MKALSLKNKRVTVTGGAGFLGKHVVEALKKEGIKDIFVPRSKEFDLRKYEACKQVAKRSDVIIHLAAKIGGIGASVKEPYDFFYENIIMGAQLMDAAIKENVDKFVTMGSVCSYPKITPTPFREKNLWEGYPEEANGSYGIAKKSLLVQGRSARSQYGFNSIHLLMVNMYGPGDNFDLETSHVIPAMIRKFYEAKLKGNKKVVLWGSGLVSREFIYVEDAAEAVVKATERYNDPEPVNIGSGVEITIKDLAEKIKTLTGFKGKIEWDKSKPDGQPRRLLDVSKAKRKFGFRASTSFDLGLQKTINWYNEIITKQN